jgi:hypothetical protein
MSNAALNFIQQIRVPSRKLVLWAIANRIGKDGRCWPSLKTLVEDTGLSLTTVKRVLSRLKGKDIIRRSNQHKPSGRQKVSIIELIGFPKHAEKNDGRGSPRASGGAQPATGEGLTASPPRGSDCASLYKEEPKYEPSCEPLAEHSEKQTSIEGREFRAKAIAPLVLPEHETVTFENGRLVLHNGTRAEWLKRFDGDETRLDLALVTAPALRQQIARSPGRHTAGTPGFRQTRQGCPLCRDGQGQAAG